MKRLINFSVIYVSKYVSALTEKYHVKISDNKIDNVVKVLSNDFLSAEPLKKKYSHSVFVQRKGNELTAANEFVAQLHNKVFVELLRKLLDYGIYRYKQKVDKFKHHFNGHCFVSVMLCVPVWNRQKVSYLSVPLGYCMWQKKESKLALAASMVRQVMPEFTRKKDVIILCDSWYVKQDLVSVVDEYPNLDLIGNARSDSVIYDLAPAPTGKRGRPAKHGRRLPIVTDFPLSDEKVGEYYTGCRRVLIIDISYCAMKLLPYMDETFSQYRGVSVQEFRFALSGQIRQQVFYADLIQNIETRTKSNVIAKVLKQLCLKHAG